MKQIFFGVLFFIFITFSLIPESFENLLNRSDEEYPLSNSISREDNDPYRLSLLPDLQASSGIIQRFNDYHPEITVERLYRIGLPVKYSRNTPESRLTLFTDIVNIFGKPGTQLGYTYHSATRDKDIELFEESYISNKRGKEISGFSFTSNTLPSKIDYFQYIDEANFSGTVFEQKIIVGDDFLSYQSTNMKSLWYFIIPVLKKEGTRNEVLFFTLGEYLYIYNCSQVLKEPAVKNLGFPIHLPSMFKKRMDVMAEWLEDEISTIAE